MTNPLIDLTEIKDMAADDVSVLWFEPLVSPRPCLQACNVMFIIIVLIDAFISIFSKRRRAESFEACCQGALLNVQIIALLFPFIVQKYIYAPVSKVHAGSFHVSAIHWTRTWTTGALTCVRDYS